MSANALKRIALLDRLDHAQGFAGTDTLALMDRALQLAGFETLDAAPFLQTRSLDPADRPDAWVTLSSGQADDDAADFCRDRSLPYHLIDPVLSDPADGQPQRAPGDLQACCFAPKADRLNRQTAPASSVLYFAPFIDPEPYFAAQRDAVPLRQNLSQRHALPADRPWIFLSVPPGGTSASLFSTFESLSRLYLFDWNLIVSAAEEHQDHVAQLMAGICGKSRHLLRNDDPRERIGFLAASDLCLSVERSGGMVTDLLEALASGLAIVANKSPVTEEIVENGITGRLSAAGNPASLSNDLTFLLRHDNFLQSYRGNTRGQVVARHDILVAAQMLREMISPDGL